MFGHLLLGRTSCCNGISHSGLRSHNTKGLLHESSNNATHHGNPPKVWELPDFDLNRLSVSVDAMKNQMHAMKEGLATLLAKDDFNVSAQDICTEEFNALTVFFTDTEKVGNSNPQNGGKRQTHFQKELQIG